MSATEQHVTDALANWYLFLWQALGDVIANAGGMPNSPSAVWRHEQRDAPVGGPVSVADYSERAAVQAAQAARLHLRLLSRAYWPNPHAQKVEDPDDWPSESVYPPARATLEALALMGWLHRPDVAGRERLGRVADVMLQSAPRQWRKLLERAGVELDRENSNRPWFVKREGGRPLTVARMLDDVFGDWGVSRYGAWSKLTHSDPRRLAELSRWTETPHGAAVGHDLREDEHLHLAGDLADAVAVTVDRIGRYTGRPTDGPLRDCRMVSERARRQAQIAADHVRERREREQREQADG